MATQQAYQAYAQQSKGTLVPGQTISVNKYTVQVERYLSQGGFAHVYLVRTPTPVYNTTHHVLKRIAVANESMLSEVKREVDVMRVLKGHPNIVHLIDAAWHRLPNGTYEVFILMEYCPGGGIIDMMNRRLRERLTEAEILQIFVDVCEGVAFMHNSRPPLLHRDLKVENILQSSATSYKLCDFGSATTVQRPPTNTQEIRALEADLGRHTTMQYRAPEMIDLYSKRPIDEKSDVWALGVLLYKLCYYTTPFEEHGSLAILNVQYRIPPYPVYSNQMNMLIATMLREHGTQRPTVFELLKHVHHLRGTKSPFTYNIPVQQPIVSRQLPQPAQKPSLPPSNGGIQVSNTGHRPAANGLRSAPAATASGSPPQNQGVQAREKVLEAIAPMRRGRPGHGREGSSSRQPSPTKGLAPISQQPSPLSKSPAKETNWLDKEEASWKSVQAEARERANALFDEAWRVSSSSAAKDSDPKQSLSLGFDNDFAEKLWRAPNPNSSIPTPSKLSPKATSQLQPSNAIIKPLSHTGSEALRNGRNKDAFEGLGLMTSVGKPAPTLAEARKLRTGLAIMSTHYGTHKSPEPTPKPNNPGSTRPTPSPRPSYLSPSGAPLQSSSRTPTPNPDSWHGLSSSSSPGVSTSATNKDGVSIESRFPSLEELDAQFSATSLYPASAHINEPRISHQRLPSSPALPPRPAMNGHKEDVDRPSRSKGPTSAPMGLSSLEKKLDAQGIENDWKFSPSRQDVNSSKLDAPSHTRSATMKYALEGMDSLQPPNTSWQSTKPSLTDKTNLSPSPSKFSRPLPQPDWLTGDGDITSNSIEKTTTGPIVREAPVKRASVILNDFKLQDPVVAQYDTTPVMRSDRPLPPEESPTVSRFTKAFPVIDTEVANKVHQNEPLSDNWSPIVAEKPPPQLPKKDVKGKEPESASSADEEGPEDLGGLTASPKKSSLRVRRKGRQSSVHELVDLWGGGVPKEKPREEIIPIKPLDRPALRPKPRPASLIPPGRTPSFTGRSVSGSPRVSPIQYEPSSKPPSTPSDSSIPSASSATLPLTPGRSRPQSMLIFPSKSTGSEQSTQAPTPLSSAAGELPTPRPVRRKTSISNMVQRYEAIGGKVIAPQQIPAVARKPSVNRSAPPTQTETGRVKVLPVPDRPVPPKDEFRPARIAAEPMATRTRTTSTGPLKPPINIPRSTTSARPRKLSTVEKSDSSPKKSVGSSARPSQASQKQEPINSIVFPKRKQTLPPAEELSLTSPSTSSGDDRPSSPEKPYQGVGKLIDQWQRKTEESNRPAVKRAGLVQGNRG